jgi:hypothetical protein
MSKSGTRYVQYYDYVIKEWHEVAQFLAAKLSTPTLK